MQHDAQPSSGEVLSAVQVVDDCKCCSSCMWGETLVQATEHGSLCTQQSAPGRDSLLS